MKHNFKKYTNNKIFIETGSFEGGGIRAALKAGFSKIYSIELSEKYFTMVDEEFYEKRNVFTFKGDSVQVLPMILRTINEPCTFWLDAHFSGGETAEGSIPLMGELKAIAEHPVKTHTIMIDDCELIRKKDAEFKDFGFCTCDIEELIHCINPNYVIHYENGYRKNDILVAEVL